MARTNASVLLVDDDPAVGKVLSGLLHQAGIDSVHVLSAEDALTELNRVYFEVVITDLLMPGMDGMELLRRVRLSYPDVPVIMMSAHGTVPRAVEAMRAGAADFVLKPFEREDLLRTVRNWLAAAKREPDKAGDSRPGASELATVGSKMQEANELLRKAAKGKATILLRGESGVGKDVAAHMVHRLSPRRDAPFVTVHCAGLPEALLESELFGSKKGAYTDALDRPGRVELAAGGTLFLDEIGDLSLTMQVKLLRLLQDRTFERLGESRLLRADVRFIAATHRDLEARVRSGEFREDLFYRLNVLQVWIPPLRERREAIASLASDFCTTLGKEANRTELRLAPDALKLLQEQPWPGNVRQLRNFIERLSILCDADLITAAAVDHELQRQVSSNAAVPVADVESSEADFPGLDQHRTEAERGHIVRAMQAAHGSKTIAAKLLGISRRALYYKLHALRMLASPTIDTFAATPRILPAGGGTTTLSWAVRDATTLRLHPSEQDLTGCVSKEVRVSETTTFRLVAENEQGQAASSVTVTVGA
jgi:two-component system, NtrC family, response regulator AtoC